MGRVGDIALALASLGAVACSSDGRGDGPVGDASASSTAPLSSEVAVASSSAAPSATVSAAAPPKEKPLSDACPENMVLVEGNYCPEVEQSCKKHHAEYEKDQKKKRDAEAKGEKYKSTVSERCMEYEAPTKCLSSERRPMRFCVDKYEYPNKKGELPAFLVSWTEAKKTCEASQKRLCTEVEFNFACEGEEMLPFTYGYVRDKEKCSIDKEYRKREKKLFRYEKCMQRPACKEHLAWLDQRLPAGSLPECVSPFGAFDMNGNINEWVEIPKKKYPDRSGLKGGWWGPVRGRCRPTVDFHKEDDYGYEEGFRCCSDAKPT